jgi:mRNA-degrading endonuclease RelE of RelBE toxin-antitoxin system
MKKVLYSSSAKKDILKLDSHIKSRVQSKIESFSCGESQGLFLRSPLQNYQKLRVGMYRIIFQEKGKDTIFVVCIEHRARVYKDVQERV